MISRRVLTGILSCILVSPLFAADGTLNIKGRVVQNTCRLESNINYVPLGDITVDELNQPKVKPTTFTLKLMNCLHDNVHVDIEGEVPENPASHCFFALENEGAPETAKGVVLGISAYGFSMPLGKCLNNPYGVPIVNESIELTAYYAVFDKTQLKPGKANVTVQVSITQL